MFSAATFIGTCLVLVVMLFFIIIMRTLTQLQTTPIYYAMLPTIKNKKNKKNIVES